MNMFIQKYCIVVCMISLMSIRLTAQNDANFTLKGGSIIGELTFASKNITFSDNEGSVDNQNGGVAMAFSVGLIPKFRLGAEVGLNTFIQLVINDFNYPDGPLVRYSGRYKINQAYFMIVPEYRIKPWLFVNGGVGYARDFDSQFISGDRRGSTISTEQITDLSYKRFNSLGYFVGVGVCPEIYKHLSLLLEARFMNSPASTNSDYQVGIGYKGLGLNIGLIYRAN